ncbi:hypothetical protein [Limnothrix redekei]|uniref:Transposase n=1 Tax=Limnothrix redekei LRLZ20PSL1 TaxID=3112953 RepID=A0ABW7CDV9_9CYAN
MGMSGAKLEWQSHSLLGWGCPQCSRRNQHSAWGNRGHGIDRPWPPPDGPKDRATLTALTARSRPKPDKRPDRVLGGADLHAAIENSTVPLQLVTPKPDSESGLLTHPPVFENP